MMLNPESARVLGCLIEKEITTPEYYPLSLNALINACNQKSNRDPAMSLDEDAVRLALRNLTDKGLARHATSEGRVPKYEHDVYNSLQLGRREIAILCELLLRGPQTPGELRSRAERMYRFEGLDDVHAMSAARAPPDRMLLLARQRPIRASDMPNRAASLATTKSQCSASSLPPAMASP